MHKTVDLVNPNLKGSKPLASLPIRKTYDFTSACVDANNLRAAACDDSERVTLFILLAGEQTAQKNNSTQQK